MATGIVQIIASIFSYFAARQIDSIIGKYLAMINVAFDQAASKSAREEFERTTSTLAAEMQSNYPDWEKWRKEHGL